MSDYVHTFKRSDADVHETGYLQWHGVFTTTQCNLIQQALERCGIVKKRGRQSLESQLKGGRRETTTFLPVHRDSNGVRRWGSCFRVIGTMEQAGNPTSLGAWLTMVAATLPALRAGWPGLGPSQIRIQVCANAARS